MSLALLATGACGLSAIATGLMRRYAVARRVVDVPNARSSHVTPTPRGGGVSIVIAFVGGVVVLAGLGLVSRSATVAIVGAGLFVALVGLLDDLRSVPPATRLIVHCAAAAWALAWLGGLPPVAVGGAPIDLGWAGDVLAAIALVWLLNLYNFMDGIDAIAGLEAVTVCIGAALLAAQRSDAAAQWALPTLLAASTLGFLVWNFPPAKIFMGDVGSGFLGLTLGLLAIQSARVSPEWLWSWVILLGAFIVDATITLLRRLGRGERVSEAHRTHAYQHAAVRVGAHLPVTIAVGLINLVWLTPWALLVGTARINPVIGVAIAYAPLVWLAIRLGAGEPGRDASRR